MYDLKTVYLSKGKHESREQGTCVMELAAYLANEPHTDTPECADPVITKLAIWLNDTADDKLRQELLCDLPWRIVGTKSTPEIERQRAYMAADWAVRLVCPISLRRAGLNAEAEKLESHPVVDSEGTAKSADEVTRAAARASYAVSCTVACAAVDYATACASYAASCAVARASYAASYAAACAVARAAACASYAAACASYATTCAAADDLDEIMRSCGQLLDRMIRLTEPQEKVCASLLKATA